jgi:hypothetical protein
MFAAIKPGGSEPGGNRYHHRIALAHSPNGATATATTTHSHRVAASCRPNSARSTLRRR